MKTFTLFCIALLAGVQSHSQEDDSNPLFRYLEGDQYVYADTAYVRAAPGLQSSVIDTLFVGDNVTIQSNETILNKVKGFKAQWSKIGYNKDGQRKEGYIWAGLLTLNAMRRSDTKFIYGVERLVNTIDKDEPSLQYDEYIIGLKVVVNKQKVADYKFKVNSRESMNFSYSKVEGGRGLMNVKHIIALTFSGQACAVPTFTYRFGWTGDKLCQLPLEEDMVDAGAAYYDEELIFPADKGGLPNRVILKIEQGEATDQEDKNGEPVYKTSRERKMYKWDGSKIIPG